MVWLPFLEMARMVAPEAIINVSSSPPDQLVPVHKFEFE